MLMEMTEQTNRVSLIVMHAAEREATAWFSKLTLSDSGSD